jgi:hypothetical protein
VDDDSRSPLFDPDLDTPRRSLPPLPVEAIGDYQRLVVNPLLAILGWLLAVGLIRRALWSRNIVLFGVAIHLLFWPFLLIQFHCLDCGTTGWYLQSRRHACAAVVARCGRRVFPRRGLRARTQLLIWAYVLVAGGLAFAIFALARR